MSRSAVAVFSLVLLCVIRATALAQTCGFPWTVTATSAGANSAAVTVCGLFTACQPHNPQVTVNGSAISITLQTSEPPDGCQCVETQSTFQQAFLVPQVPPGTYTVTVTLLSCSAPEVVGSTVFTQVATLGIPVMDARGVVAFVILAAIAGIFSLRR